MAITIKSEREIELMAEAGKILERVHNELEKALRPGMRIILKKRKMARCA